MEGAFSLQLITMHPSLFIKGELGDLASHVLAALVRARYCLEQHRSTVAFVPYPVVHMNGCFNKGMCAEHWSESWRATTLWLIFPTTAQRKDSSTVHSDLCGLVVPSMRSECREATLREIDTKGVFEKEVKIVEEVKKIMHVMHVAHRA